MSLRPFDRPYTARELAGVLRMTPEQLERFLGDHEIQPEFRLGRTRAFGPRQVRRILDVLAEIPDNA